MANQQLVSLEEHKLYEPKFDVNTGLYVDDCPFIEYQRNCPTFKCRCTSTSSFDTRQSFKSHIRSKGHKQWLEDYPKYFKERDEALDRVMQITKDYELLRYRNIILINNCKKEKIMEMKSTIKELEEYKRKSEINIKELEEYKRKSEINIKELEEYKRKSEINIKELKMEIKKKDNKRLTKITSRETCLNTRENKLRERERKLEELYLEVEEKQREYVNLHSSNEDENYVDALSE